MSAQQTYTIAISCPFYDSCRLWQCVSKKENLSSRKLNRSHLRGSFFKVGCPDLDVDPGPGPAAAPGRQSSFCLTAVRGSRVAAALHALCIERTCMFGVDRKITRDIPCTVLRVMCCRSPFADEILEPSLRAHQKQRRSLCVVHRGSQYASRPSGRRACRGGGGKPAQRPNTLS